MDGSDCKHWQGDSVDGYWLCAKCLAKLPDRPQRLLKPTSLRGKDGAPYPQDILNAPIATAQGYTLGQFVESMALRLMARGGFQKTDAINYAIDLLRALGEKFGSDDMDWTSAGAWEIVDDDMQYWDADESASN